MKVYSGMVIGQNPKAEDIEINVCKTKKLTNTRSSSADEALKLTTAEEMSLEQCLDFIDTDELSLGLIGISCLREKVNMGFLLSQAGFLMPKLSVYRWLAFSVFGK